MKVLFKSSLRIPQALIIVLSATISGSKIFGYLLFAARWATVVIESRLLYGSVQVLYKRVFLGDGGLTKNAYFAYVVG